MMRTTTRFWLLCCILLAPATDLLFVGRAWAADAPSQPIAAGDMADAPIRGPATGPVTIVEYADFHCSYCAKSARTLRTLLKVYPTQVRWVFKHFSLSDRPSDLIAHEAAIAAQEQGKFWEMHDLLFANPTRLRREHLFEYAQQIDLDMVAFTEALGSRRHRERVIQETEQARRAGIRATPTFLINGTPVIGAQDLSLFRMRVEAELARLASPTPRASP